MAKKLALNKNGVVTKRINMPDLKVVPTTKAGRRLVRLHKLIVGESPKICIVRGGGIGDLLMTTPAAKFIKKQYPHVHLTYAVDFHYLDGALPSVLEGNPYVDKVVHWKSYDEDDFDAVLNLQCPCVAHERPGAKPISRIDLFARHLGIYEMEDKRPVYVGSAEEDAEVDAWLNSRLHYDSSRHKLLVVSPFSSAGGRSFPIERMKETLRYVKQVLPEVKVVVCTHDSDFLKDTYWDSVADAVAHEFKVRKFASLLSFSRLVLCQDSAALHLCGALDISVLALFGSTDPRARVNHYPKAVGYCPGLKLQCFPCWYNYGNCSHSTCWRLIEPKDVAGIMVNMLTQKPVVSEFLSLGEKKPPRNRIRTETL